MDLKICYSLKVYLALLCGLWIQHYHDKYYSLYGYIYPRKMVS